MKGKPIWAIVFTLLLANVLMSAFIFQPVKAEPATIYINADGSITPSTAPISTLDNVTYTLSDNVNESIVVQGSNIVIDGEGYTVQGSSGSGNGIDLESVNNVTVENASVNDFHSGIELDSSSNNTVSGNNMTGDIYGVELDFSSNNMVYGNNITDSNGVELGDSSNNMVYGNNMNGSGVNLVDSSNNMVYGNNMTLTFAYGVWLGGGSNNTISQNYMIADQMTGYSVMLMSSSNNTVSENIITNNVYGVALGDSSNNTVAENTIANNAVGIDLEPQEPTPSAPFLYSSDNVIYHNNFINNVFHQALGGLRNVWDNGYPSGGNYWSDYNGTDLYSGPYQNVTGSDGIGDTPYLIDANNIDNYPLMGAFSDYSVAKSLDVQVVSNSTVSDFQFNGMAVLFNVSGVNGTTGFCNVCVPTALLNGTLTVFVNGRQVRYSLLPSSNSVNSYLYFTYRHSTEQVTIMPARSVSQGNSYFVPFVAAVVIVVAAVAFYATVAVRRERKRRPPNAHT